MDCAAVDLVDRIGLRTAIILNDFEAQALAAIALGPEHIRQIGGDAAEQTGARVVLGPGTGLGVSGLVHARGCWIPVPGEGGHIDIGPRTARDFEVFSHIEKIEGRVSAEQMLSGRGLVNIYRAIATVDGAELRYEQPSEITSVASHGSDPISAEALDLFVTVLGRIAGDLALIFMASGGVYLSGGIAQKIVPALMNGKFRAALEDNAPHSHWLAKVPAFVITHPLAALEGLK